MNIIILLMLVYLVGIVCVLTMQKIQQDRKSFILYTAWVAVVCIALTCFLVWYVS